MSELRKLTIAYFAFGLIFIVGLLSYETGSIPLALMIVGIVGMLFSGAWWISYLKEQS